MAIKRVFWIILDSLGIGAAPDADLFGDAGANTLLSISRESCFRADNLIALGLANIEGVGYLRSVERPLAAYGRLRELSRGKDTTTGHWELCGIVSERAMPTYPNGFPEDIIERFSRECKRGVLCNATYSGTEVIKDYGKEHKMTGNLIVYTSADSVFQIAAHEDIVPPAELYEYCKIARKILVGEHSVGRVIARPFIDGEGGYIRTANRRDFSLKPPSETTLDRISASGKSVIGVGKIWDIFAGCGVTESYHTHSNGEGMKIATELLSRDFSGLCFVNLVDFDSKFGHRQDASGYARALAQFDLALGEFMNKMQPDDMLVISADHGCDPSDSHTDHTREYVPLLVYGDGVEPRALGTLDGFYHAGRLVESALGCG